VATPKGRDEKKTNSVNAWWRYSQIEIDKEPVNHFASFFKIGISLLENINIAIMPSLTDICQQRFLER
jgi:hypothetical protein